MLPPLILGYWSFLLVGEQFQQRHAPVAVTPFVVVPADDLHELVAERQRQRAIEDARMRVAHDVLEDERLVAVFQDCPRKCAAAAASLKAALMPSAVAPFLSVAVNSVREPSGVGTRKEPPLSLPFNSGITSPMALAAPVELGTMLIRRRAARGAGPRAGRSRIRWSFVYEWIVVMKPASMPNVSWSTLAKRREAVGGATRVGDDRCALAGS